MSRLLKKKGRKRVYVDREIQGGLVWMAARYWAVSLAVVGMLTVVGWVFVAPGVAALVDSPERMRSLIACLVVALVAAAALLPIVLMDMVRFSHRFVGPMVRLRESMRRAAAGESVDPVQFRDADYWQDLADAFNAMQARIEQLEQRRVRDIA